MKEIFIPQGSDQEFEITCKDENDVVIDFTTGYQNLVIIVYNRDRTVLEKYSRTTTSGWVDIDVTNQATGILVFKLLTSNTDAAIEGKKYFEVRVQKTDATVGDGSYDIVVANQYLCTITESVSSTITLP